MPAISRILLCIIMLLPLVLLPACGGQGGGAPSEEGGEDDGSGGVKLNPKAQQVGGYNPEYKIALAERYGEPMLDIELSFDMPNYKEVTLVLPDTFLRKASLYERVEDLRALDGTVTLHPTDKRKRSLKHEAGKRVILRYFYRPDDPISYAKAAAAGKESFAAPIIRSDYFQFVGSMALIYPIELSSATDVPLRMTWDLPADFVVSNSFGHGERQQNVVVDFEDLRDGLFVAGKNIKAQKIEVRGQPVWVTFEGTWDKISYADYIDVISRLLTEQRKAMNDDNFPYFLVHLLSIPGKCERYKGTAHAHAFRASLFDSCELNPAAKHLLSHEMMHMWIGKKIKVGVGRGLIDGKVETEGWTDFVARVIALAAGVITEDEYFELLNQISEKYFISKERNTPLSEVERRMYIKGLSDDWIEDLPYQQGEIMALRLNKRIKSESSFKHSFFDVLRDMLKEVEKSGAKSKNFKVDEIAAFVDKYTEPGTFAEENQKVVQGREFIPPKLTRCRVPVESHRTKYYKWKSADPVPKIYRYDDPSLGDCSPWFEIK